MNLLATGLVQVEAEVAMEALSSFFSDLWYAVRVLVRTPVVTVAAILTLGLGIGATSGVFSVVQAVLLTPLPYSEADRRVMIWSRWKGYDETWLSDAEIVDYRTRISSLTAVAAWSPEQGNLVTDAEPRHIGYGSVTANLFSVLGAEPLLGRTFTEEEDRPGGPKVAVLGYTLWRQQFGGDPTMLDRTIRLDGVSYTVVGVMSEGFQLPTDFNVSSAEPTELWVPLRIDPSSLNRGSHGYYAAGELAPGSSAESATAELRTFTQNLTREGLYPEPMQFSALAVPMRQEILGSVRPAILLLSGAVAFLLLIACANVAHLMLAAAEGRRREMALRSALGARAARLVRQLLTESLLLASTACGVGLFLAWGAVRVAALLVPKVVPRGGDIAIDGTVIGFAVALALLTTILFGLAPAVGSARTHPIETLKEGAARSTAGRRRRRVRSALVVAEMALAVVLVIGAGLMIRSLRSLEKTDLGFDPDGVLTLRLSLPAASYDAPEKVVSFYQNLLSQVRALPGVRAAGAVRSLPLGSPIGDWGVAVEGYQPPPGEHALGDWQVATAGVSETLGEKLVAGRFFLPSDTTDSQPVALVNETMARKYWADGDPVGKRFRLGGSHDERPWVTVVGIVGDERHNGVTAPIKEKFYLPHAQWHRSAGFALGNMTIVVGTAQEPLSLASPIRALVRSMDPNLPLSAVRPMTDVVNDSIATTRLTGLLLGLFSGLALALAAIGIYAVLSYLVSTRTQEIGIRIAMGARRRDVLGLVVGRGFTLAAAGIVVGVAASLALTRLLASFLYGVAPTDLTTFVLVPAILGLIALLASFIPGRRASRVDPIVALRTE
jgi:putative ABC transport system permease protein